MKFIAFLFLLIPVFFLNSIASPDLMPAMKFIYYIGLILAALSCAYAEAFMKFKFRYQNFFSIRNTREVEFREGFIKLMRVISFIGYIIAVGVIMYRASKGI